MNQTTESSHVMVIPQRRHALRIAFGYAAVSIIWILGSGWLLHYWVKDTDLAEHIEIYKGWLFVAVTAFLLWAALNRYFRAIRQSHGRLQENEAKFKAIVESAIIPISISKDNRIVFANQALASLFGHKTPETLAGKSITDLTEPDSRSPFFVRIDHPRRRIKVQSENSKT